MDLTKRRQDAQRGVPGAGVGLIQAQENIISDAMQRRAVSPDVAETIRDIFANDLTVDQPGWIGRITGAESPNVPTYADIIANYADAFDTPEEYEQFKDLLATLY